MLLKKIVPLILFIFFISCNLGNKKSSITIKGHFEQLVDSSSVTFCRPFDDNPEHYFLMYDEAMVTKNSFRKSFHLNKTGIITIAPNSIIPKTYLICEPGDEITLFVKRDSLGRHQITFRGKSEEGQALFHTSSLRKVNHLVEFISKFKNHSPDLVIEKTSRLKDSLIVPFKEMKNNGKISESYYAMVEKTSEAAVVSAIYRVFGMTRGSTGEDAQKITKHFYTQYDPFSERYRDIDMVSRTVNAEYKNKLIAKGVLDNISESIRETPPGVPELWDNKFVYNKNAPYELQEKIKAIKIMFSRSFNQNPFKDDYNDFSVFKVHFPESPYINVISEKYFNDDTIIKNLNKTPNPSTDKTKAHPASFAFFSGDNKQLRIEKTYENNNLSLLLETEFKGKPVLVDMWATWCSPCIKEFAHKEELHTFLHNNDISILYVSVDKASAFESWKLAVAKYGLEGNHFFATEKLDSFFPEDFGVDPYGIGIPRYLLFDKNGTLLDDNLPRPSSGEKMYERIEHLLAQ
ncbi:redoxin family protein [Galbibacter sp. EGI 63066]|uniref:redoxin family protein n=1 Tax=Galbibacter sp. EGI 63066 TaxID=2993559 RepID=UPI002248DFCD|nr:redoxin family protein [Galbibacter sp. EGI 63066]MCX2678492.1 redoxin family protein [Galbibacter sp. EGI 63066]